MFLISFYMKFVSLLYLFLSLGFLSVKVASFYVVLYDEFKLYESFEGLIRVKSIRGLLYVKKSSFNNLILFV